MNETDIMREIQTKVGGPDIRLFRFQCGRFQLIDGRWINVGVPGMSDLIGLRSITITPEMVGRTLAVFAAVEVKSATGRATEEQKLFIEMVSSLGGFAGVARSVQEATELLNVRG